jgi:hypothetical protein
MAHINHNNSRLTHCNHELNDVLAEHQGVEERAEQNKQVVQNVLKLLDTLPPTSPYHLSLLHFFMQGFRCADALNLFNLSPSSYQHAHTLTNPPLLGVKYKPNTTRKMVSEERMAVAVAIFHNWAPMQSGQDHQVKNKDDTCFYVNYKQEAVHLQPGLKPLRRNTFIKQVDCPFLHSFKLISFCILNYSCHISGCCGREGPQQQEP